MKHIEKHFKAPGLLRDIIIGMSDGLTVPFALAAGISGAVASTSLVVTAGVAEIAAGSIAMGLGGFLAGRSDFEHYLSEEQLEWDEVKEKRDVEKEEVATIFKGYGLTDIQIAPIIDHFDKNEQSWVDFMMRFELGLDKPSPKQAFKSAATIGISYIVGGIIPLAPYIIFSSTHEAMLVSIAVTLMALAIFGYMKGIFMGHPLKSAFQTMLIGGIAAGVAYFIAKFIG